MATGWERLGDMLGGGGRRRAQSAYDERIGDLIKLGRQDQGLQQDIMTTQAHRGIGDQMIAAGMRPEDAAVAASVMRGGMGTDYSSYMQGQLRNQEHGFRQAAFDAPDMSSANRALMGVASGPVQLATVEGQNLIGNRLLEGGGSVTTTDQGQAGIAANRALAGQRNASANLSNVRAAAGGFAPRASGGGSGGGKRTQPNEAALKRAFETQVGEFGGVEFDQERYLDFMRWWEQNPIGDGNQALAQYQMAASGRGLEPIFVDPSMPGQPRPQAPARPQSKAEYDALPSGAQFVAPDGSMRIKP